MGRSSYAASANDLRRALTDYMKLSPQGVRDRNSDMKRWNRLILCASIAAVLLLMLASVAYWQLEHVRPSAIDRGMVKLYIEGLPGWPLVARAVSGIKRILIDKMLLSPVFYVGVVIILTLEWLFPADRSQKLFSVSLGHDFVWLLLEAGFTVSIIGAYVHLLRSVYNNHLSFLTVEAMGRQPDAVRFIWAVLLADFLGWFHHWVRHKVTWFWYFHTIHHSQRQLNMFTDLRYHVVEYLISNTIKIMPLLMLRVDAPKVILYTVLHVWYTQLYHGNIKSNFGPLRYILVTPQSHRVHHSVEPRHVNKNFGVLFSIWDRLLGTQYRCYDEYPETGIHDPTFPHETTVKGFSLIVTPLAQLIYPFRVIKRSVVRQKREVQFWGAA